MNGAATVKPTRGFLLETWGCQMNVHDSEKMAGLLKRCGYTQVSTLEEADLILLNTCSVREKAAEKVFSRLGQLRPYKKRNPELLIGVCGCVAQAEGEAIFRRAPYVDLVMGPRNIAHLGAVLEQARRDGRSISLARDDDPIIFPSEITARASGPRAYVTVMEGCNKACAFCIVPFTRGREVYRGPDEIMEEVRGLAARGYCEIELLGQNVNAYRSGGDDLSALLHKVDRIPGVRRIRFTTSHPGHLKSAIMDAMRDVPGVCNHLHLPVQSGSDRVLNSMNRGYSRSKYMQKIAGLRARVPDISFSTDIIVGFPGETSDDFHQTLSLIREVEFDRIFAFTYSPRPGTTATKFDCPVPEDEKSARLRELLGVQDAIVSRRNADAVGRTYEVLIDGRSALDETMLKGRTTCSRIVNIRGDLPAGTRFIDVRITRAHAHSLSGEPLSTVGAA